MPTVHIHEAQLVDPAAGNDKFYRTYLWDSCWLTQYGRNGEAGTFTKLVTAASPEAAATAAAKKLDSKVKKGYQPTGAGSIETPHIEPGDTPALALLSEQALRGAAAAPTTPAPSAITSATSVRAMLARDATPGELTHALISTEWALQFKYDGDRLIAQITDGAVGFYNRQGRDKVHNRPHHAILGPLTNLSGNWVFDGEIVGGTYVLFDLIEAPAVNGHHAAVTTDSSFLERWTALELTALRLGIPVADKPDAHSASLVLAPTVAETSNKQALFDQARVESREGVIARRLEAAYQPAQRAADLLKVKFVHDAEVIITALHPAKESASLSVFDATGQLQLVGSASTLGKSPAPTVGDIWQVRFLYVADPAHPRLVQPRLISLRTDKDRAECSLDQFATTGTNRSV